jgi:hypothetical protein
MVGPFCEFPFSKVHVHCDGSVFMCCFQQNYPIGNLLTSTIEEVWFGESADAVRSSIMKGNLPPVCHNGGCPYFTLPRWSADHWPERRLPSILCIDLPNYHCNIGGERPSAKKPACIMCERGLENYKFHEENNLPMILPKIRDLLPHIHSLHVQGVAEAFWKDAIFEVLELLDFEKFKERIIVTTVTNGTILTEQRIQKLIKKCARVHISFSIDAGSQETYRKIRHLNAYDLVLENIKNIIKVKNSFSELGVRIQNNINTLNVHEIVEMVRVAHMTGVDEIEFNPTGGRPVEILVNELNYKTFSNAQRVAELEAKRLGVRATFMRPLDMGYSN